MYNAWKENAKLPNISELERLKPELITIKPFEPENDGYIFLHGVALAIFKGRMYCAWAHNKVEENSDNEEVNYAVSDDNGKTWSKLIKGDMNPESGVAVSHGAFLVHEGGLYFFAPLYKGRLGAEMMKMGVYAFDEENDKFRYVGVGLDDRFWPMCEPIKMENGSYIMAGIYVAESYTSPNNTAAVAVSRGSDITHWDMVKIPKAEGVRVWGECTVVVKGNTCKMYCREHSGKLVALYSESHDFGSTWTELDCTNLSMIDSKPYAGSLSNGRNYLITSCAADIKKRNPLTVAVTEPGEDEFSKIFIIDSDATLSYPYAIESEGKLYVAYSYTTGGGNRNGARLAIIDVEDLR